MQLTGGVQIRHRAEHRGGDRDHLAGGELSPSAQKLGQAATGNLIKNQYERAVGQCDGAVPSDQMPAVDLVVAAHLPSRQGLRDGQLGHRDDLEHESVTVQAAHGGPFRAGRTRAARFTGDDKTRHERRNRDDSP